MMMDMDRENHLQKIVQSWDSEQLTRPGGIARAVREFTTAYGNWAYLCGDQFHLGGAVTTDALADRALLKPGLKVLDAACFLGGPSRYLARRYGCQVTGLDISSACIQGAIMLTEAEKLSKQVSFLQGDMWQMPLEDGIFDVVWGQDSWPHAAGLFEECARVLRPQGTLAFTNSVRGHRCIREDQEDEEIFYEAFTAREYEEMLGEAGFEQIIMEDIVEEIIPLWQDLEQRLIRQRGIWQQKLGEKRLVQEEMALAETIEDYLQGRIGHVRVTAVKRG